MKFVGQIVRDFCHLCKSKLSLKNLIWILLIIILYTYNPLPHLPFLFIKQFVLQLWSCLFLQVKNLTYLFLGNPHIIILCYPQKLLWWLELYIPKIYFLAQTHNLFSLSKLFSAFFPIHYLSYAIINAYFHLFHLLHHVEFIFLDFQVLIDQKIAV